MTEPSHELEPSSESAAAAPDLEGHIPPASFSTLITMLASQAMVALGQIPDPVERKPIVRPKLARHFVDMIAVLEEKTKGNLAPDEAGMIEAVLHQLRMVFVTLGKR